MEQYLVIEYAPAYGVSISRARRFTDEEAAGFADWYKALGFVGLDDSISLDMLTLADMPKRSRDGEFAGCNNQAWIITEEERDGYVRLNGERRAEAKRAETAEMRKYYEEIIERASRQPKLYTREEAKRLAQQYNDLYNEGGEGYVPHYYTADEVEAAKEWLSTH